MLGLEIVPRESGSLRHDQAVPALQSGLLDHDECWDALAARPGVNPLGFGTSCTVATASRCSSQGSSLGSAFDRHASGQGANQPLAAIRAPSAVASFIKATQKACEEHSTSCLSASAGGGKPLSFDSWKVRGLFSMCGLL